MTGVLNELLQFLFSRVYSCRVKFKERKVLRCKNINPQNYRVRRGLLHEGGVIDSSGAASGVKSLSRFEGELSFSSAIIRATRMHVIPRVYLRLGTSRAVSRARTAGVHRKLTSRSVTLPRIRRCRARTSACRRARIELRNVSDTRAEITHAVRAAAEFTKRGCDKNSFSKSRSDCARARRVQHPTRVFRARRASPVERKRVSRKLFARGSSYRVSPPPLFCLSCSIRPAALSAVNSS